MNAFRLARRIRRKIMRMVRYLFGVKSFQEARDVMLKCQKSIEHKLGKKIESVGTFEDMRICGEQICLYETLKQILGVYEETKIFELKMKELEEYYGY